MTDVKEMGLMSEDRVKRTRGKPKVPGPPNRAPLWLKQHEKFREDNEAVIVETADHP